MSVCVVARETLQINLTNTNYYLLYDTSRSRVRRVRMEKRTSNPRIPILAALDVLLLSCDDDELKANLHIYFVEKGPKMI